MADQEGKVYRKTQIVGTSTVGFDDGAKRAIVRAMKTLRNVMWFEVKEQRGRVESDGSIEYQTTIEVGFLIEDAS